MAESGEWVKVGFRVLGGVCGEEGGGDGKLGLVSKGGDGSSRWGWRGEGVTGGNMGGCVLVGESDSVSEVSL